MPELPEVEVVRRGLVAALTGRTIGSLELIGQHGPRAVRRHVAGPADFVAAVTGRTVADVRRRGKYLWFALDDGDAVLAHLGMSGQFRVLQASTGHRQPLHPHTRIRFHLLGEGVGMDSHRDTDTETLVDFLDQRTFGGLSFVPDGAELPASISHIARDVLDSQFDRPRVVKAISAKHSAIKRVLLDQSVISGIGNIYADEALWAARVHGACPADSLSTGIVGSLIDAATDVMCAALDQGGTSFDALYVNVNGESGYFERSLNAYGRAGMPCGRCGAPIGREKFMNRSSFFCPRCQPSPSFVGAERQV
ncbi:MAG: bifunctional DNA-formamidopyrimidine glycosylase/DNA-(apurinic or apyrimidinic site) lyase [Nakamurella sp.]